MADPSATHLRAEMLSLLADYVGMGCCTLDEAAEVTSSALSELRSWYEDDNV